MNQTYPNKAAAIRTLQIVVGSMVAGTVLFALIAIFMQREPDDASMALSIVAAIMAGMMLMARTFMSRIVIATPQSSQSPLQNISIESLDGLTDDEQFLRIFPFMMTKTIISTAMLEAAAFFALVAYLVEGHLWTLGIAAAVVAAILLSFPTRNRIESSVRNRIENLEVQQSR